MLLPMTGGEALPLGELEMAPGSLTFSPDGKRLGFLAATPDDKRTRERKEQGDDARVSTENDRPGRLWTISRKSGRVRAASPESLAIWEYSWLPGKEQAVVAYSEEGGADAQLFRTRLGLLEFDDRAVRPLAEGLRFAAAPSVSPDGRYVALLGSAAETYFARTAWVVDPRQRRDAVSDARPRRQCGDLRVAARQLGAGGAGG